MAGALLLCFAGHRAAKAAPLANGHMDGSGAVGDGSGSAEDEDGEEGEEEDVDLDGDADVLLSGSGSLDDEKKDGEGEEDGAGRTRGSARGDPTAGRAAAASCAAGSARRTRRSQGAGGELEQLEAEYEALQEEDDQHLSSLRQKGERDRTKGRAVRHQQVRVWVYGFWSFLMEGGILVALRSSVVLANGLDD